MVGHIRSPQAHRHKQQAQPAAHQKGEGPFDIGLGQGNQGGHHRGGTTHRHQGGLHQGAQHQQGLQAQQHPGTAQHHHRIAQHRGGQGALHGLIQPKVQGNLGALAHGPGHQGEQDQGEAPGQGGICGLARRQALGPTGQAVEIPGARHRQDRHQASQQHQIANALGEEGIPGPFHHQGLVVPGAHHQVGAEGEEFQQHIAEKEGIGEHQGTQTGLKKAQATKKAGPTPVHFQIANRIDLGEHVHPRNHRHGDEGGFGYYPIKTNGQSGGGEPLPTKANWGIEGIRARQGIGVQRQQGQHAVAEGHSHH